MDPITARVTPIHLETLREMQRQGITLGADEPAEQFLGSVQQAPSSITLPSKVSLPVRGVEDLAVLDAIYHSGAPAVAAHPGLQSALRAMHQAGVQFVAIDSSAPGYRDDNNAKPVDVGPYGAWLALNDEKRFHRLEVVGQNPPPFQPDDAEALIAHHVFTMNGDTANLAHPQTAATLVALSKNGASLYDREYSYDAAKPQDVYLKLHRGKLQEVTLGIGGSYNDKFMRVQAEQLDNPAMADEVKEKADRYKRLAAANKTSSSSRELPEVLKTLDQDVPGHPMAEREAAMITLLGASRGYDEKPQADYEAVIAAARPDETLDVTAKQFMDVLSRADGCSRSDVYESWKGYTALEGTAPPQVSLTDKRALYLDVLSQMHTSQATREAFAAQYGDGQEAEFPQRRQWFYSLLETEKKFSATRPKAVEAYQIIQRTRGSAEDVTRTVAHYATLAERKSGTWGQEWAHDALRIICEELPNGHPHDLTAAEKEDHFVQMLCGSNESVKDVWDVWTALAQGGTKAEFGMRQGLIDRLVGSHGCSQGTAARDLKKLDDAMRGQGGLQSPAAERMLRFMDMVGSFDGARDASQQLEKVALPAQQAEREGIFLSIATVRHGAERRSKAGYEPTRWKPDDKFVESCMNDYWYVARNAVAQPAVPAQHVADQYAQYLEAAAAQSSEARTAHGLARTRLQDGGPLGVPPQQRQQWLVRTLRATANAEQAYDLLGWAERSANAEQASQRVQALEHLMPMARGFDSSKDAFAEASILLQPLEAKAGSGKIGVGEVAAETARIFKPLQPKNASAWSSSRSASTVMEKIRDGFVKQAPDLDRVHREMRDFEPLMRDGDFGWEMLSAWPSIRENSPTVSNADKVACISSFIDTKNVNKDDVLPVYRAISANVTSAEHLCDNADVMRSLLQAQGARDSIQLFETIHKNVQSSVGASPGQRDPARMRQYAEMAVAGTSKADLETVFEKIRVPVGAEDVTERERSLTNLVDLEKMLNVPSPVSEAVKDYQTIADTLYPGESLSATVSLYCEVADAVRRGDRAREVISALQKERLAGHFADTPMRDLVHRFATSYAVSGDVGKAIDSLHNQKRDNTVKHDEDVVVVGGLRIPKRKMQVAMNWLGWNPLFGRSRPKVQPFVYQGGRPQFAAPSMEP